jgi:hypothetical protein
MSRHVVEVDQSNKIEYPGDSVLAFSNGISWAIKISSRVKQGGLQALLRRGKPEKRARLLLFAACVFLLVERHLDQLQQLIIDNEYDSHEADVRSFLLEYVRKKRPDFGREKILVRPIKKHSPADRLAGTVRRGKQRADRKITLADLLGIVA